MLLPSCSRIPTGELLHSVSPAGDDLILIATEAGP
jgi:hypothetical protein